jgi:hypothetical protein
MSDQSSLTQRDSSDIDTSPDSLAVILGQVVAHEREQYRHARELVEAQLEARLARFDAMLVERWMQFDARVAARLAELHDGAPGRDGERGQDGRGLQASEAAMAKTARKAIKEFRARQARKDRKASAAKQGQQVPQALQDNPVLKVMPELLVIRGLLVPKDPQDQ